MEDVPVLLDGNERGRGIDIAVCFSEPTVLVFVIDKADCVVVVVVVVLACVCALVAIPRLVVVRLPVLTLVPFAFFPFALLLL